MGSVYVFGPALALAVGLQFDHPTGALAVLCGSAVLAAIALGYGPIRRIPLMEDTTSGQFATAAVVLAGLAIPVSADFLAAPWLAGVLGWNVVLVWVLVLPVLALLVVVPLFVLADPGSFAEAVQRGAAAGRAEREKVTQTDAER